MNVKLVPPRPSLRRWPFALALVACVALASGLLRAAHPDLVAVSRGLGLAVVAVTVGWIALVTRDLD
ncbi:MAG: hypothetical protein U0Q21_05505 [Dermatophilaceae bacterium]